MVLAKERIINKYAEIKDYPDRNEYRIINTVRKDGKKIKRYHKKHNKIFVLKAHKKGIKALIFGTYYQQKKRCITKLLDEMLNVEGQKIKDDIQKM